MDKKPKNKKQNIIKKANKINRNTQIALIILVIVAILTITMIAGIVIAASGGFLVLYRPDSLSKGFDRLEYSDGSYKKPGGSTGIPDLLPGERFYMPVPKNKVTSQYGNRYHPNDKVWRLHAGIDIGLGGTYELEIFPSRPGVVVEAVKFANLPSTVQSKGGKGWGQYVKVEHDVEGKKMHTLYAHMFRVLVDKGDVVNMDTPLGIVGNTGNSKGAHLHFEVFNTSGVQINPRLALYCGGTELKDGTNVGQCYNLRGELD